ncbi:MAG: CPBP family intramembrane glutamic endopeptidase [Aurantibacter sp.]
MESQIENTHSDQHSWIFCLGEILLVFLPAFLFVKITSSWVGEDTTRSFGVIWVANILMLAMVWTGMKLRGKSWKEFGLTFTAVSPIVGLRIFGLSLLVFVIGACAFLMGPVLMANIAEIPESADFSRYDYLKDNLGGLFFTLAGVYIASSFGEEVIYRAFLINRISELVNSTKYSGVIAVLLSSIFFGLIHYEWGPMGMVQTGLMGLAMGICYIKLKRRLWILILAHAYLDTLLMVQLYMASN